MMTAPAEMVAPNMPAEADVLTYYARRARTYDRLTGYEMAHHREAIRLARIEDGDHVLEVACGTGRATVKLARQVGPHGKLDAIDLSDAMRQQAQQKVQALGLSNRVDFRSGNANQLPYGDQAFDVVYNAYMFDLIAVEQFVPILHEFQRVLRPGGRLVLVNMSKSGSARTRYEAAYAKGWIGAVPCRPVVLTPFVQVVGLEHVERFYRKNYVWFVPLPFGTEIVIARKPAPDH
jgi:ubiquinone/menaquinone biosynthesis C-methylase UbiE